MRPLVLSLVAVLSAARAGGAAPDLSAGPRAVSVAGRVFRVQLLRVPLAACRVKVGLAQGRVGATEPLAGIARRCGAAAAINGCFFGAYTRGTTKPPYHHLITGGELVHQGDVGTTLGFDAEGNYRMGRVAIRFRGEVADETGRSRDWYAYRLNHPLESASAAGVYTRWWVGLHTPNAGVQVQVRGSIVTSVGPGRQPVPADGYVLLFAGGDRFLGDRFRPGDRCTIRRVLRAQDGEFWERVQEALGCGPRLVTGGRVSYDPVSEGFRHAKILSAAGQRSAVGVTADRVLLLVTCSGATVRQLAGVMRALGAYDAMNLDGGASSGLWVNGRYLTRPGREISNALLILRR